MKRSYEITWYANKDAKYKEPTPRHTKLSIGKPTGETSIDAKAALGVFTANFGSLARNTIVSIKEFDENGNQLGEDITPSDKENSIIPVAK
jgi:hypothetical protein